MLVLRRSGSTERAQGPHSGDCALKFYARVLCFTIHLIDIVKSCK